MTTYAASELPLLSHILIRNFAIIDRAELELGPGMTVLTGETGAGKSILVEALGLVLGDRADTGTVRHGSDRAEITASFDIESNSPAGGWLAGQELDADGECVLRRVVGREGRSKAFINGQAVPLRSLTELGSLLVDIHGQHAHQSLTRRPAQLALLDEHGGHSDLCADLSQTFTQWQATSVELDNLRETQSDREARLDLLRYQVSELEALGLGDKEIDKLEAERLKLANHGRLVEGVETGLGLIHGDDDQTARSIVARAAVAIRQASELDPSLGQTASLIEEAEIQLAEASEELRRYQGAEDVDPARHQEVEKRLDAIHDLARKHRIEPDTLPAQLDRLSHDLEQIEDAGTRIEELSRKASRQKQDYLGLAKRLSGIRAKNAQALSDDVTAVMQQLGMPGGRFVCELAGLDESKYGPNGIDAVEFMVTANPGQPPGPVSKVASGGELSRISLAIQVILAGASPVPSLVFDEVDSGIGGGIAEIVGRRLRDLASYCQVMCVTHLPQVASQSHNHLRITKITDGKTTRTTLTALGEEERIEELARMLGGVEITRRTREHAREMIVRARSQPL